jgi:subtilisin family serine protease
MIKRIYVATTLLLALFALELYPTQLAAQSQAPNYVPDEIIVKYRDGVEESKKDLARFRVSGQRKKQFKLIPGLEVIKLRNISVAEAIDLYKQDPDILYAEPNYILYLTAKPTASSQPNLTLTPDDPSFGSLWGLTKINAPSAWNLTTGSDQVFVVVIDTGIDYTHPDLAANMGLDADGNYGLNVAYGNTDPMDDHYHGTHVAGTIGAVGNNGTGVVGVNWNVKLLACKFFDAFGSAPRRAPSSVWTTSKT